MTDQRAEPSNDPRAVLKRVFGFDTFRQGQEEVVTRLLAGRSALSIFPTGGGKSLCYQLPALVLDDLTVVISPLQALMKDQVDNLTRKTGTHAGVAGRIFQLTAKMINSAIAIRKPPRKR